MCSSDWDDGHIAVPGNWGFDEASLRMAKDRYMTIVPDPNRPPDEPVRVLIEFAK